MVGTTYVGRARGNKERYPLWKVHKSFWLGREWAILSGNMLYIEYNRVLGCTSGGRYVMAYSIASPQGYTNE